MKYWPKFSLGGSLAKSGIIPMFLLAVLVANSAPAVQSVTLAWDPSPDSGVASYSVYYGTASGSYSAQANAGLATSLTVTGLIEGETYYFAATAIGTNQMESDFSNEISYTVPTGTTDTPPSISPIAAQEILEDGVAGPLSFTIGDAQTAAGNLVLTGSSSNTGLVPNANIVFGGSGASRTIKVTPAANHSGTAQITVTVSDGSLTASSTFTLTVNPVNDAPTLAAISPLTVTQPDGETGLTLSALGAGARIWALAPAGAPQEQAVALTGITTGGESSQSLTVTAASGNTNIVAQPSVTYSSPGSTATLRFTPVAGAVGTAQVTVTVRDNGGTDNGGVDSVQRNFAVTVAPPANTAPTLAAISAQTLYEDKVSAPLSFSVSDAETAAGSLVVTVASGNTMLLGSSGLQLGGSGTSRTLTLSPSANQYGKALVTLNVKDAQGATASRSFWANVNSVNDAPTLNPIANVFLPAPGAANTIELSGITSGPLDGLQTLTVQAVSSSPSLIPNPEVAYITPNSAGVLQLTSSVGVSGTATITVTVKDNGGTANGGVNAVTRSFQVTVPSQVAAAASASESSVVQSAASILPPSGPRLRISTEAGWIVLQWDADAGSCVVERSTGLDASAAWSQVETQPEQADSVMTIRVKPQGQIEFFRLVRL